MPSLKVIRKRISSVKSTQQITRAMKMVSAAKLRRAQEAATAARPHAEKLGELLRNVAAVVEATSHPLLARRDEVRRVDLLLITADRGLCGAFNANLVRRAESFLQEHGERAALTNVGRKGYDYFKKRPVKIAEHHVNLFGGPSHDLAVQLAARFADDFATGKTDGVYLLFSAFHSTLSQVPTVEQLLPIAAPEADSTAGDRVEYIYEPDAATLLERLLRQYVMTLIDRAFLESVASEHAARMTAMDSATNNAGDMMDRLTLQMNRARQAAITTELMEIVSGAEALKG